MKRIAVLTSGGDSSGMNSCIEVLFNLCQKEGYQLIGYKYGYQGLIDNKFSVLTHQDVQNIFSVGGSVLKTSRCDDFRKLEGKKLAAQNLIDNNIDYLIVIGGNGSIKGASEFEAFFPNIICIPATIDNDLGYTNQTLGFDTAVNNAVDAIVKMKQSMQANDRGLIVETMGRHCSDIATYSAVASQADLLITEKLDYIDILKLISNIIEYKTLSPLIVLQENLYNLFELCSYINNNTSIEFKCSQLGYIQRSGEPTVCDKILATEFAYKTIELIKNNKQSLAIGKCDGKLVALDLNSVANSSKKQENNQLKQIFNLITK